MHSPLTQNPSDVLISPPEDIKLRPLLFKDFTGQLKAKAKLQVMVSSATIRHDAMGHILLSGPPGLGKTTLANILANELKVPFKVSTGPALEKPADLIALLAGIEPRTVLFIDEIHRMPKVIEEYLYSAIEDYFIDILIDDAMQGTKSVRIQLPKFTLIGATTRPGMLSGPMLSRFTLDCKLDYYNQSDLTQIVQRSSKLLKVNLDDQALSLLATCARGTPRLANNYILFTRDYALHHRIPRIDLKAMQQILATLEISPEGLTQRDLTYLSLLVHNHNMEPAGLNTLAAAMSEDERNLEDVIEPYLLQCGYIERTHRGRRATPKAKDLTLHGK